MEKRALIAFVLSLAVLLFWEIYFGLYRTPEPQAPREPGTASSPPPTAQPPANLPETAAPPSTPSVAPEQLPRERLTGGVESYASWMIDAALYDMQIISPGGLINSFKLEKYHQSVEPDSPRMQLISTQPTGYLPLAVDLLHHTQWQTATRPYTSGAEPVVSLAADRSDQSLSLWTEVPGELRLTKTFTLIPGTYTFDVAITLKNLSQDPLQDQMGVSFYFLPYLGSEEDSYNPSQLTFFREGSLQKLSLEDLAKEEHVFKPAMDWVGYENNYFIQALIPLEDKGFQIVPRTVDAEKNLVQMVYLTDPFQLPGGQEKAVHLRMYMGPKVIDQLAQAGHNLPEAVDYGWFSFLAKPLLRVLEWFHSFTYNYGLAIILLTLVIKIIFWPLTHKSYKSMQMMKKLQPKIAQVREKYKDDREKLNQELMMLYRTYKVNPLGGCLPMLLQIPVFFALYRMLYGAVELRHEPFMLWINDLTAPDRLHVGVDIPYLGGIPVLTLLMGASMFIQQKMTPTGGDPRQEQIMLLMPVIFTVFFINFPSGLVLYWLVNNILSIVQQYWINRHA